MLRPHLKVKGRNTRGPELKIKMQQGVPCTDPAPLLYPLVIPMIFFSPSMANCSERISQPPSVPVWVVVVFPISLTSDVEIPDLRGDIHRPGLHPIRNALFSNCAETRLTVERMRNAGATFRTPLIWLARETVHLFDLILHLVGRNTCERGPETRNLRLLILVAIAVFNLQVSLGTGHLGQARPHSSAASRRPRAIWTSRALRGVELHACNSFKVLVRRTRITKSGPNATVCSRTVTTRACDICVSGADNFDHLDLSQILKVRCC
mmetsp:Transcript_9831/g.27430  ORF Transcript_9831/g.27430 Transcript_9831/m.27430 type:complete len:265 (+) Transcript_9831:1331-2125(+)